MSSEALVVFSSVLIPQRYPAPGGASIPVRMAVHNCGDAARHAGARHPCPRVSPAAPAVVYASASRGLNIPDQACTGRIGKAAHAASAQRDVELTEQAG